MTFCNMPNFFKKHPILAFIGLIPIKIRMELFHFTTDVMVIMKKLEKYIHLYGFLPYEKVIELLKKSGIGLGIYTDENPWTKYGDSMKVREYVAYGLPVVITNVPSTADDIKNYHAGIVIKQNKSELIHALTHLLSSKYILYKKNALRMAKENDYNVLLKMTLKNLHI